MASVLSSALALSIQAAQEQSPSSIDDYEIFAQTEIDEDLRDMIESEKTRKRELNSELKHLESMAKKLQDRSKIVLDEIKYSYSSKKERKVKEFKKTPEGKEINELRKTKEGRDVLK